VGSGGVGPSRSPCASLAASKATAVMRSCTRHLTLPMAMNVVSSLTTRAACSGCVRRMRSSTGTYEVAARARGRCAAMRCTAMRASSCAREPGSACSRRRAMREAISMQSGGRISMQGGLELRTCSRRRAIREAISMRSGGRREGSSSVPARGGARSWAAAEPCTRGAAGQSRRARQGQRARARAARSCRRQ